jgi:hypothetical protein
VSPLRRLYILPKSSNTSALARLSGPLAQVRPSYQLLQWSNEAVTTYTGPQAIPRESTPSYNFERCPKSKQCSRGQHSTAHEAILGRIQDWGAITLRMNTPSVMPCIHIAGNGPMMATSGRVKGNKNGLVEGYKRGHPTGGEKGG